MWCHTNPCIRGERGRARTRNRKGPKSTSSPILGRAVRPKIQPLIIEFPNPRGDSGDSEGLWGSSASAITKDCGGSALPRKGTALTRRRSPSYQQHNHRPFSKFKEV